MALNKQRSKSVSPGSNTSMALFFRLCAQLIVITAYGQRSGDTHTSARKPQVIWSFTSGPIVSSPVVSDGLVYVGSEDSTWYALDVKSGKVKWKLRTGAPIRSTPAVSGNRIFLAGGNGVLACADKSTGTVQWRIVFDQTARFMGERSYDFADYYHASPVVNNGVIYFGSGNGVFGAYRADDGTMLWRYTAGDIIHCSPVIAADHVIFGSFDGYVHAVNRNTGTAMWKFKTIGHQYFPKGEVQGQIATDGQRVFFGARDYNFYALDARSGSAVWNRKFDNGWAMSATVADTIVYIGTSDDRVMVAADARTGREYWKTDVKFNVFGAVAVAADEIVLGTIWGKAYGLDRASGQRKWFFESDGFRNHHMKYFDEDDQFRANAGAVLKTPFEWIAAERRMGGIFSTPALHDDVIIITTTEGKVYALK